MSDNLEIYKILVVGLENEGERSNFVKKATKWEFLSDTKDTIGVGFNLLNLTFKLNGEEHVLGFQLWDMNEDFRYKCIREYYAQGTQGLLLCIMKGNIKEINYLIEWIEDIHRYLNKDIPKILVRIATDLKEDSISEKNKKNIMKFLKKWAINDYIEISTTTGENITKVLDMLAKYCYENNTFLKKSIN